LDLFEMDYKLETVNSEQYITTKLVIGSICYDIYFGLNGRIKNYIQIFSYKTNQLDKFIYGDLIKNKIIWGTKPLRTHKKEVENIIHKLNKLIGFIGFI